MPTKKEIEVKEIEKDLRELLRQGYVVKFYYGGLGKVEKNSSEELIISTIDVSVECLLIDKDLDNNLNVIDGYANSLTRSIIAIYGYCELNGEAHKAETFSREKIWERDKKSMKEIELKLLEEKANNLKETIKCVKKELNKLC